MLAGVGVVVALRRVIVSLGVVGRSANVVGPILAVSRHGWTYVDGSGVLS